MHWQRVLLPSSLQVAIEFTQSHCNCCLSLFNVTGNALIGSFLGWIYEMNPMSIGSVPSTVSVLNRCNEQNVLVQIHYCVCKLTINQYLITGFMLRDNSIGGHCVLIKCVVLPEQPCMLANSSMN